MLDLIINIKIVDKQTLLNKYTMTTQQPTYISEDIRIFFHRTNGTTFLAAIKFVRESVHLNIILTVHF